MPDRLYDAILTAINKPLDGELFEQCAVDLLRQHYYASLRPVEGGQDAGMDGIGELPDGEEFFLVSTVSEDARANLDRNIRSYLDAGGDRRTVVFATSRVISGQAQMRLKRYLRAEFGVDLRRVHARGDFVQLLYRHPQWRIDLLGIPGVARALTRVPMSWRPTVVSRPIGRDQDLSKLRSVTGDLVLIGKPGIGKTFLLESLMDEDWGLFDAGWDIPDLEEAIREFLPHRVVIDDAHLVQERIARVRQLRREMGAMFDIVAVAWPGEQTDVAAALPGSSKHMVSELDRSQILEVIRDVGIDGPPDLQALILDEAMGRAGLAVSLAYAYISGNARDVATGEALGNDLVSWHARVVGSESRYVLAFLALAGGNGATVKQLSEALSLPPLRANDVVRGLASGGTLDEILSSRRQARLRVQPEIFRYALVRDVFFGGPGSLDVAEVVTHLERQSDAVIPIVGAIHRGASVSRDFLLNLVDPGDDQALVAYALLGTHETQQSLELAPLHAKSIARAAYDAGLGQADVLPLLMDFAVGDLRPENSAPDHPLRIVGDYLRGPHGSLAARTLAVSIAERWIHDARPPDVGLRVIAHALYPGTRHVYSDPALGNRITIRDGVLAEPDLQALSRLWDSMIDCVQRVQWPSYGPVADALHAWVYPSALVHGHGPGEASARFLQGVAKEVIAQLAVIWHEHPGALQQLRNFVASAKLELNIAVPSDFEAIFPAAWDGSERRGGHTGWESRIQQALVDLVAELRLLPAEDIAMRLTSADNEAAMARISFPRLTDRVADAIASEMEAPELLLSALEHHDARPDVLLPVFARVVDNGRRGWESTFEQLLSNERTRGATAVVALTKTIDPQLKRAAIRQLNQAHVGLIDTLVIRGEVNADTVNLLLDAPDQFIAREAAVALAQPSGAISRTDLSDAAYARWRQVVVRSAADEYWYSVILKRDEKLFLDWLKFLFERVRQDPLSIEFMHESLLRAVGELPSQLRARVIRALPADAELIVVDDLVAKLVSADLNVGTALFKRQDLSRFHSLALKDGPSEPWIRIAIKAVELGWEPAHVVAAAGSLLETWWGDESAHWQQKIDAFEALRNSSDEAVPTRARIIHAAVELYSQRRDRALEEERRERIFGQS